MRIPEQTAKKTFDNILRGGSVSRDTPYHYLTRNSIGLPLITDEEYLEKLCKLVEEMNPPVGEEQIKLLREKGMLFRGEGAEELYGELKGYSVVINNRVVRVSEHPDSCEDGTWMHPEGASVVEKFRMGDIIGAVETLERNL